MTPTLTGPAQGDNTMSGGRGYYNDGNKTGESAYEQSKRDFYNGFSGYNSPRTERENPLPGGSNRYGKPEENYVGIFRTRSNPRMLIYEYADRYDYWLKADDGGMEYVRTETKSK